MIDEKIIKNELNQIDDLLKKSTVNQYTKNYILIRLSAILENGIKISITKILEQYKNKNNCNKGFFLYTSFNELKQISNNEKSIDEVYFGNNQNLTNVKKINDAFKNIFGFKIFELLDFCSDKKTNYENKIERFISQRNEVVHNLMDTTFSPTELLNFKDVLLFFLKDLQIFMHSFGELIQDTPRTGKLSNPEQIQLKKRFLEIKKSIL